MRNLLIAALSLLPSLVEARPVRLECVGGDDVESKSVVFDEEAKTLQDNGITPTEVSFTADTIKWIGRWHLLDTAPSVINTLNRNTGILEVQDFRMYSAGFRKMTCTVTLQRKF